MTRIGPNMSMRACLPATSVTAGWRRTVSAAYAATRFAPRYVSSAAGMQEDVHEAADKEDLSTLKFPAGGGASTPASRRRDVAGARDGAEVRHLQVQRLSVTRFFDSDFNSHVDSGQFSSGKYPKPQSASSSTDSLPSAGNAGQEEGKRRKVRFHAQPFGLITLFSKRFERGQEQKQDYPSYLPWPPHPAWATGRVMRKYATHLRAVNGEDANDAPVLRTVVTTTIKEYGKSAVKRHKGRARVNHALRLAAKLVEAREAKCLDGALLHIQPPSICGARPRSSKPPAEDQEASPATPQPSSSANDAARSEHNAEAEAVHMDVLVRSAVALLKRCIAELNLPRDGRPKRGSPRVGQANGNQGSDGSAKRRSTRQGHDV